MAKANRHSGMQRAGTLRKMARHPQFAALSVIFLLLLLPPLGASAMVAGCAAVFSVYVWATPEVFHSRRGSLKPAIILAAILWASAALVITLELIGGLKD